MTLGTSLFLFPHLFLEVRGYVFSIFGFSHFLSTYLAAHPAQRVPFNVCVCGGKGIYTNPTPSAQLTNLSVHRKQWLQVRARGAVLVPGLRLRLPHGCQRLLPWDRPPHGSNGTGPELTVACARPSALHSCTPRGRHLQWRKKPWSQQSPGSPWFSHFNRTVLGKKSRDAGQGIRHLLKLASRVEG